jgi:acetyl-CoA synthetase
VISDAISSKTETNASTASDELVTELQQYAKEQTAPYKYPRLIDFVAELPKTNSGKVRRAELRS